MHPHRMATVYTDVGDKYKQPVTPATPAYAAGGVRMEDAHASRRQGGTVVLCVADGHGSVKRGEGVFVGGRECADAACAAAVRHAERQAPPDVFAACQAAVVAALRAHENTTVDEGVLRMQTASGTSIVPACGTTLSVAVLRPRRPSTFAWVGDSLGVLVRGNEVTPLGTPHTTESQEERRRMQAAGTKRDGKYFEYRVDGSRMRIAVSRTLGHVGHPGLSQTPDTLRFTPLPGDRVLIATDGLWDVCTRERAGRIIAAAATEAEACDTLMKVATASPSPRDNVTVACVFLTPPAEAACCVVS